MKSVVVAVIVAVASSLVGAQVSPEEHAAHHPGQTNAAPAATATPPAEAQQKLKTMHELMEKIQQTRNPAERKRLLGQHHDAMRALLDSMKHMDCGTGMGQGGIMDGGMMKCHQMMQGRMEMIVGMMDQMLQHEGAEHATR